MNHDKQSSAPLTGKGTGPQGVDKAPGEEAATSTENFTQDTQKGKGQVDADPADPKDRPIQQA